MNVVIVAQQVMGVVAEALPVYMSIFQMTAIVSSAALPAMVAALGVRSKYIGTVTATTSASGVVPRVQGIALEAHLRYMNGNATADSVFYKAVNKVSE